MFELRRIEARPGSVARGVHCGLVNEAKRDRVLAMLADPAHSGDTLREIARACGVGVQLVRQVRAASFPNRPTPRPHAEVDRRAARRGELLAFLATAEAPDMEDAEIGRRFGVPARVVYAAWEDHFAAVDRSNRAAYVRDHGGAIATTPTAAPIPVPPARDDDGLPIRLAVAGMYLARLMGVGCVCWRAGMVTLPKRRCPWTTK